MPTRCPPFFWWCASSSGASMSRHGIFATPCLTHQPPLRTPVADRLGCSARGCGVAVCRGHHYRLPACWAFMGR